MCVCVKARARACVKACVCICVRVQVHVFATVTKKTGKSKRDLISFIHLNIISLRIKQYSLLFANT